jgi:phosphatidylglycerol:prolipoprotein diacylglycerol transferase
MVNPIAWHITLFGLNIFIHWYGIIIAAGLLLAILLAMYHTKREGKNPDNILDLALIIIPLAVICARIYYVLFNWNEVYAGRPFWHVFAIWEGGLAIYGGVIGGFLGILIYNKFVNKQFGLLNLLDIGAPSLILGQAIGRWGNFFNQEAYGAAVTNPSWQWFPASVFIQNPYVNGVQQAAPGWYMATFFYESIWDFLIFAFLFFYFKNFKKRKPGNIFWFYLLLYGIGRSIIEGLRTDSLYIPGTEVRVSQLLSILLVIGSACVLLAPLAKKLYANYRERLANAEEVPLDESLKLTLDQPEEPEEEPQQVKTTQAPAEEQPKVPEKEDKKEG